MISDVAPIANQEAPPGEARPREIYGMGICLITRKSLPFAKIPAILSGPEAPAHLEEHAKKGEPLLPKR